MDLPTALTHLGVFLLGVFSCRALTLWEGKQIKNRGGSVPDQKTAPPSFSRRQISAVFILLFSLLLVGIGFQQISFQKRFTDAADCYSKWGRDVTDVLEKRSNTNSEQKTAERARDNAIDDVFLLILGFREANPPLSKAEQRKKFNDALDTFGSAKQSLVKADAAAEKVKADNAYPVLDCQ